MRFALPILLVSSVASAMTTACPDLLEIPVVDFAGVAAAGARAETWEYFTRLHRAHGPAFTYQMPGKTGGEQKVVHLTGPTLFAAVVRQGEAFARTYHEQGAHHTLGSDSILLLDDGDPAWRATHRLTTPAFAQRRLRTLGSDWIADLTRAALTRYRDPRGELRLREFTDFIAAAVIHRLLFGLPLDRDVHERLRAESLNAWRGRRPEGHSTSEFRRVFADHVRGMRDRLPADSLAVRLWGHRSSFTEDWWMDQLTTLYFAGNESTRTLLAFGLFELAREPRVQQIFVDGSHDARVRFVDEVLRRHAIIAIVQRRAKRDVVLDRYLIPGGSLVNIDLGTTLASGEWFPEPDRFDPGRFAAGSPEPLSHCPFGFGPRVCPGQFLAVVEAEAVLSTLIAAYRIRPTDLPVPKENVPAGPRPVTPDARLILDPR